MLLKRPLRTLIIAGCCVAALAVAGTSAQDKLSQTSLSIPGTESARTEAQLRHYFGESAPFAILLKGPEREVNAQGRQLVQALERDPSVSTFSPWSHETSYQLRPTRRSAVILVSFRVSLDQAVDKVVPRLNDLLRHRISAPVQAVQSGYASISRAIQDESVRAARRGELIALPVLLLVLLLVFRSPVAAAIPLAFGAATVAASGGILSIAANWLSIDGFALTVSAMLGLALGVDYALLMVSRFREELAAGKPSSAAAQATRHTAGRTIVFAGGALFVSMTISAMLLPGTLLVSLAGAVVVVTGFSVAFGVLVIPALLSLVGKNLNRWSIGTARSNRIPFFDLLVRALRRPGLAAAMVMALLVALSLPVISLKIGPPSFNQLPPENSARLDAELIEREIGPGWGAPFVVLAATDRGTITGRSDLAVLNNWQRQLGEDSGVQAVIGPGSVSRRIEPIRKFGNQLLAQERPGSQAIKLQKLGTKLGDAAHAVAQLRGGISRITYGADLLAAGSGNVDRGAHAIAGSLATAAAGSHDAVNTLGRLTSGTHRIRNGQRRAAVGALALKFGIRDLIPRLRHGTLIPLSGLRKELHDTQRLVSQLGTRAEKADEQLGVALLEFQKMSEVPDDPHYSSALSAVQAAHDAIGSTLPENSEAENDDGSLSAELLSLHSALLKSTERTNQIRSLSDDGLNKLRDLAALAVQLSRGLDRLERGGKELDSGATRLAQSASVLAQGMPRLSYNATALSDGTETLADGTSWLTRTLADTYTLSHPLEPALYRAASQVTSGGTTLQRQTGQLHELSPSIFDSEYFALSALDGTPPSVRLQVEQVLNINSGGQAAQFMVIPESRSHTAGSVALDSRLRSSARDLGRRVAGVAGVAGGPAVLDDYAHATASRVPLVIAAISLVTFLILVIVLRALLVPALTVILNLLSAAVAFGALTLLSHLPAGFPFGGWEYIDAIGSVAIYSLIFGLSIDYAVFLLVRMREELDRSGDHTAAVRLGVQRTGRVITGAAAIMLAVFATFATANLAIVSQLGIGLTVAIFVDATIIRLVLLPALLLLMGKRAWWLPPSLNRFLVALRLT